MRNVILALVLFVSSGAVSAVERTGDMVELSVHSFNSHVTTVDVRDSLDLISSDLVSMRFGSSDLV